MKNNIKTWRDVWGPYFSYYWGYVNDNFGTMAFSVSVHRDGENPWITLLCNRIADVLETGNELDEKYEGLEIKNGCDLYWEGLEIGSFRGWGHLTGPGGLNLPEERATELQNQMIDYVMTRISKDYGTNRENKADNSGQ